MKEKDNIKELFFNYPTKQWHFEELIEKGKLSRAQTNIWLKRLLKEDLIKKIKPKNKMPYYMSNYDSTNYKTQKRLFALKLFEKSGFLQHLAMLKAKTVILFGSFTRSDWHKESDIDLFIYGSADDFEKGLFEKRLKREIQVFNYNKKTVKRLETTTFSNIIKGMNIKNNLEPFKVSINA